MARSYLSGFALDLAGQFLTNGFRIKCIDLKRASDSGVVNTLLPGAGLFKQVGTGAKSAFKFRRKIKKEFGRGFNRRNELENLAVDTGSLALRMANMSAIKKIYLPVENDCKCQP